MESGNNDQAKKIIIFLLGAILANLLFLDFREASKNKEANPIELATSIAPTTPVFPTLSNNLCPNSCIDKINEATASIKLEKPVITVSQPINTHSQAAGVKEFFIPLGTGTNSTDDWEDIPGLQVSVDTSKYGKIKNVVFEATVRVPTLDQWTKVRLFNVTDKQPISSSEVSFTIGSQPTLLVSSPINLDNGVKTYQVQMKTQLKHTAFLDQSRIHITTY